jgi:hypothetical protein
MNEISPAFTKQQLEKYLSRLNDELRKDGTTGEVCIVGGAAMVIGFGTRNSTRDIDALVISPSTVRAAILRVAQMSGIPNSWLNDAAKGFASSTPVELKELLKLGNLRVVMPPAEYILAMKCISARVGLDQHDKEDARFLIKQLGLKTVEQVLDVVGKYYVASRIPAKTQYFVKEICDELVH